MVKIEFELGEEPNLFKDAIVLTDNHSLTEADIEELKKSRYNNWLAVITAAEEI